MFEKVLKSANRQLIQVHEKGLNTLETGNQRFQNLKLTGATVTIFCWFRTLHGFEYQ